MREEEIVEGSKAEVKSPRSAKEARSVAYLAARFRPYLLTIARIYVESAMSVCRTQKRVRQEIPSLATFSRCNLRTWAQLPEWQAAVAQARHMVELDAAFSPEVRGEQFIAWAREALAALQQRYADLTKDHDPASEKQRRDFETRILRLQEAMRAVERRRAEREEAEANHAVKLMSANIYMQLFPIGNRETLAKLEEWREDPSSLFKPIS